MYGIKRICHLAQFFITSHGSFQHFTIFLKKNPKSLRLSKIFVVTIQLLYFDFYYDSIRQAFFQNVKIYLFFKTLQDTE